LNDNDFINFDLKIGEAVTKYLYKSTNDKEKHSRELKNTIISILFLATKNEGLNNKTFLILNAEC